MIVYSDSGGMSERYSAQLFYIHNIVDHFKEEKEKIEELREISEKHDDFSAEFFPTGIILDKVFSVYIRGFDNASFEEIKNFLEKYDNFHRESWFDGALDKIYHQRPKGLLGYEDILHQRWKGNSIKKFKIEDGKVERIFPER